MSAWGATAWGAFVCSVAAMSCGPDVTDGSGLDTGQTTDPGADTAAPADSTAGSDGDGGPTGTGTTTATDPSDTATTTDGASDDVVVPTGSVRERARALAQFLIGRGDFMVGLGNDNSGPWDNDVPIDLHYAYLVGYGGSNGWPDWNEGGQYPVYFANTAIEHGATPMYTYYQLALELENGADAVLGDAAKMGQYLADIRLLYTKLAELDRPAVVGFEPDFFGYLMSRANQGTAPSQIVARIHVAAASECGDLPEDVTGLTRCIVRMARAVAPKVRVGFHASMWGAWYDELDPNADVEGSGRAVAEFLKGLGAEDTDFVGVETLDRDAGFWETSGGGDTCSITEGSRGAVYWDEANVTLPNFHQHLRWVGALTGALGRPAIWWQTPLGVPSATCGGSDEHFRDNRVHYFFSHIQELVDAGGAGMTFGTGAGRQTHLGSDGGQFKDAATAYRASPFHL